MPSTFDPPDVPPGIVLAAMAEDHVRAVPGDLRLGDVAVGKRGQRRHLAVGPRRPQHVEVPPGAVGRARIGHHVGLPPAVGLLDRADVLGIVLPPLMKTIASSSPDRAGFLLGVPVGRLCGGAGAGLPAAAIPWIAQRVAGDMANAVEA